MMKKRFALMLLLTLGATGFSSAVPLSQPPTANAAVPSVVAPVIAPQKATGQQTAKTTNNLHLRSGASTKHKSLKVLKRGTTVTRTGKTNGKWLQVKTAGKTGWVSSSYLTKTNPKPKPASSKPQAKPTVKPAPQKATGQQTAKTTNNLHLRSGASTKHKSLKVLRKGTTVTKTGKTNGKWLQVKTAGKTGWVSSSYLTKTNPKPKPASSKPQAKPTVKKAPASKALTRKPKTRAELIAYAKTTMAPYCPDSTFRVVNGRKSTYRFVKNEIALGADLLNRSLPAIKFVVMHECAHNLQDRAAGGFKPAHTAARKHFKTGLNGGAPLETQADIMAQIMSEVNAKQTGFYTKSNPSTAQLNDARATINKGRNKR